MVEELEDLAEFTLQTLEHERVVTGVDEWDEADERTLLYTSAWKLLGEEAAQKVLRDVDATQTREFIVCHARGYPDPYRPWPNTLAEAERFVDEHGGFVQHRLVTVWEEL